MKRFIFILCTILFSLQQTQAQDSKKIGLFREKVLPEYNMYFNAADLTVSGQLSLFAVEGYTKMNIEDKGAIMAKIFSAWKDSIVQVRYGSKREIWGFTGETRSLQLLDVFDLNSTLHLKTTIIASRPHPWFFYLGAQFGGDNQHDINVALNLRLGFFLLLNRWDLATTFSGGLTGNTQFISAATGWSNVGLMSRVHFPIKKIGLSPNIGGQITMSVNGSTPAQVNGAVVAGLSWYVGIGCLDIGVQVGNVVTGMIGFTLAPKIRRK